MTKLAKYLKSSAGLVVAIVALLFLQAYCDLTLPEYTSKIVNEGIQQKGIEDGVPDEMREETYDTLMTFLDEDGQSALKDSYEPDGDVYQLKSSIKGEKREALASSLLDGEMVVTALQQMESAPNTDSADTSAHSTESVQNTTGDTAAQSEAAQDATEAASAQNTDAAQMAQADALQLPAGVSAVDAVKALPEAVRSQTVEQIKAKFDDMPEMMTVQSAILFVQNEYEALGKDLDSLQISYLVKVGVQMVLLALLAMLASVLVTFFSARVAATVAHDLRGDVYRKVIGFNSHEFNQFSTASLITRSTNDIQQIQMLLAMGFRLILYSPILGIGGVLKVIKTDVSMSWIIALAVILIMLVIGMLFKVAMPRFTKLQTLIDRLNLVTREQLTGIMVSRAFSAEKHEEERFEQANQDLTKTNLFVNRCMTFMMPIMMLIMNGISVLIVYKGAYAIDDGTMQVGDLMAFIQYAMQIIMSFLMISMMSIIIPRANVAAKRIYEVLSTEPTIHDPDQPKLPAAGEKGTVEFDHVSFAYPEADEKVLEDISFRAEKGQTVAIIGSTGSGKSTLINLIPRFYDVTSGAVRVDGVDVREMAKKDLCARLGYVPQKSVLFSGTIDSNLRYGCTDASEEEIRKRRPKSHRQVNLLKKKMKNMIRRSPRAERTYPVGRSRGFQLRGQLQRSRRS